MTDRPIPETVTLDGIVWTIDGDPDGRTREGGDRGTTYPQLATISIDDTLPRELLARTLVHELVHAAWESAELSSEDLDADLVERIVSHLGPRILDLLRDPDLVAYVAR